MRITIDVKELKKALVLAKRIVPTHSPKPILSCLKMVASKGCVVIEATDLEIYSRQELTSVIIEEEGGALIPVKALSNVIKQMDNSESCTLETDGIDTTIRGFSFSTKLSGYEIDEYPSMPILEGGGTLSIPTNELSRMLDQTLFAVAKLDSHYAIAGILWEVDGNKTKLVATDGYSLSISKGKLSNQANGWIEKVILPSKLADIAGKEYRPKKKTRIGFGFDNSDDVLVCVTNGEKDNSNDAGMISLSLGNTTLFARLLIGNFPKHEDIIPATCGIEYTLDREKIKHCLEQMLPIVEDIEYKKIKLDFQKNELTISATSVMGGDAKTICPLICGEESTTICFNCRLLLGVFSKSTSDTVVMGMNGLNKAAKLTFDDGLIYVLMPVEME